MKKYILPSFIFILFFGLTSCGKTVEETVPTLPEVVEDMQVGWEGAGTEPFWAFRFTGGKVTWQEPGEEKVESYTATGSASLDEKTNIITIKGGDFAGVLTPDTSCSDGMSDNTYAFRADIKKDTRSFKGCAREYIK